VTEIHYARSGDVHVAYQVTGDGPVDVIMSSYANISVDAFEREPHFARFLERLGRFARVIRFDTRGRGLSDPITASAPPTLELEVADAIAVLDAAHSERAAIFGYFGRGPMAILLAATFPERVAAMILFNTFARGFRGPDYPWGIPESVYQSFLEELVESRSGTSDGPDFAAIHAPSLAGDEGFRRWWEDEGRRGASPSSARVLGRLDFSSDARDILPSIRVPSLVIHRIDNRWIRIGNGRYLAEHIDGAKYLELPGADQFPFAQDSDLVLDEIEEFLTGSRGSYEPDRVLATLLFTDIVSSTQRAASAGDHDWREMLDRHDAMVRRQIHRFGGREVKPMGDGFLATFEGPARGVRCAVAIREGAAQLGLEVRAGVHTGEIELRDADVGGIAVHVTQRISSLTSADEVLVSSTVVDLVAGSGLEFEDRGDHELKGVPRTWRLFAVHWLIPVTPRTGSRRPATCLLPRAETE
jgi:class 3 adenylate cyclase